MLKKKYDNPEDGKPDEEKSGWTENVEQGTEHELTVKCPHHDLPLQTETETRVLEDGKTVFIRFAVCKCRVEGNNYYGQRVWEKS